LQERLEDTLAMLGSFKPMKRHGLVAYALYDMTTQSMDPDAVAQRLVTHPSDVARCWASDWVRWTCCSPGCTMRMKTSAALPAN
jgi:hypothetical protein